MKRPILTMENISKSFPGVKALDDVTFNIYSGEAMALIGENGAGKSTLMKILSGVYKKDAGSIKLNGELIEMSSPNDAIQNGIGIIHQELNLVPDLSVTENIFLGREIESKLRKLNKKQMHNVAESLLESLNIDIDPNALVSTLSIAQQQMVEISKALSLNAEIIVMDEPTDTLTDTEVESLFNIIDKLKAQGKGIVYISHRLGEIMDKCERVTVLRDGKLVDEKRIEEVTENEIIRLMVGRTLEEQFPFENHNTEEDILVVENLCNRHVDSINFSVKKGEILGISGLVGAGRTELSKTLYGAYKTHSGSIVLNGKQLNLKSPKDGLENGIVYVSEDRKHDGLILMMDIKHNISLPSLDKFKGKLGINQKEERRVAEEYVEKINIRTPSINQTVENLSGGNQQKVAIARALLTDPEVLILDEPTRGVDVGAKREIYELLNKIKEMGKSIIMVSSEMPEILGMSDRILVLHEGKQKGILNRHEATQEKIMSLIMDGKE